MNGHSDVVGAEEDGTITFNTETNCYEEVDGNVQVTIEQKIIKTGKLEDMTEQELETRMKQIIEEYAPILDAKPIEELKKEVKEKGRLPAPKNKDTTVPLRPLKQLQSNQD